MSKISLPFLSRTFLRVTQLRSKQTSSSSRPSIKTSVQQFDMLARERGRLIEVMQDNTFRLNGSSSLERISEEVFEIELTAGRSRDLFVAMVTTIFTTLFSPDNGLRWMWIRDGNWPLLVQLPFLGWYK